MNGLVKGILAVLIIIYIASPIDLCPGPIDDVIIALAGIASISRGKKNLAH